MVRPTVDGSNECVLTVVTTHARRLSLTVVEISPDATATTVTAIVTEATHTSLREIAPVTTDKVTMTTVRLPTPALTHPSSSNKTPETPETRRSPSLYTSLILEHLQTPPRLLEPPKYATALRTMQTTTQIHVSRELFAPVVADQPIAVRPPSQFRV